MYIISFPYNNVKRPAWQRKSIKRSNVLNYWCGAQECKITQNSLQYICWTWHLYLILQIDLDSFTNRTRSGAVLADPALLNSHHAGPAHSIWSWEISRRVTKVAWFSCRAALSAPPQHKTWVVPFVTVVCAEYCGIWSEVFGRVCV